MRESLDYSNNSHSCVIFNLEHMPLLYIKIVRPKGERLNFLRKYPRAEWTNELTHVLLCMISACHYLSATPSFIMMIIIMIIVRGTCLRERLSKHVLWPAVDSLIRGRRWDVIYTLQFSSRILVACHKTWRWFVFLWKWTPLGRCCVSRQRMRS